jgi:hypothetical protein
VNVGQQRNAAATDAATSDAQRDGESRIDGCCCKGVSAFVPWKSWVRVAPGQSPVLDQRQLDASAAYNDVDNWLTAAVFCCKGVHCLDVFQASRGGRAGPTCPLPCALTMVWEQGD